MKNKFLQYLALAASILTVFSTSCQDDLNSIGESVANGEVNIEIDSLGFILEGKSVACPVIDARTTTNLLGRLSVPEYGDLKCTFVTRLMAAQAMRLSDTIIADSVSGMKMHIQIPRGQITGDSLAPQQLKVYKLTRQLPDSITNQFDPTGYYDPSSPLGSYNFTLSAISQGDSAFYRNTTLKLPISLPKQMAIDVFKEYREKPETFAWPSTFAKYFPGIYVETSFGRGCVANISDIAFNLYYRYGANRVVKVDSTSTVRRVSLTDSVTIFSTSPIVLSSNNISLNVSDHIKNMVDNGDVILQTPAGYNARIKFPAQEIIDRYNENKSNMAVINNLSFTLPVDMIKNDHGISAPPYLLMIKAKEIEEFFAKNKVPDNKSSFWGSYSNSVKGYNFTTMRDYIVDLVNSGQQVKEEDMDFMIVPVEITIETSDQSTSQSFVTSCTPYLARPTMCKIDLKNAKIKFTYSTQKIY